MSRTILLVDDDAAVLDLLRRFFEKRGWGVSAAATGAKALSLFEEEPQDIVLLDLQLPDRDGLTLLREIRTRDADAVVLMLTGHGDIATAVAAMQDGAENFLTKPVEFTHLEAAVERAFEKVELRRRNRLLSAQATHVDVQALGNSPTMRPVVAHVQRLAASDGTVLLQGETGTGKGYVAQLLHALSSRATRPFVEINCAGLSATFLESELFGHERGAFTDARTQKRGLLEVADRGTLFLDEIGDLAPELQPKLLKVIESRRFRRLGGTRELSSDVRVIAATNRALEDEVRRGRFREDLYYRIAVLPLRLPPLRERGREEIIEMARRLLAEIRRKQGVGPTRISTDAGAILAAHDWPGNIRELRNVLERADLMATGAPEVRPEHLPAELRGVSTTGGRVDTDPTVPLDELERRHILHVLEHCGGNRSQAARVLGISRATLYEKLKRYSLTV